MSDKKLAILGVIAVAAAGWAILQSRLSAPGSTADFSSSPLIEGLAIDSVASIVITGENGAKSVTLDRSDKSFVLRDKDGYPADVSKINGLINKCLDIRVQEKITGNAANHADLKVTPETAKVIVTFMDKDGKPITGFAISESDPESGRAYARLLSSDDVYAIGSDPWIGTGTTEYLDTRLLEAPREKISKVAVRTPAGEYRMTVSDDGAAVKLENVPQGQKQKDSVTKSVFGALNYLTFEDVMKEAPEGAAFDHLYTCRLSDTTVYKLSMAKVDDKVYAKVSADYLDKTPVEKERRVESEEELKQKEAKLQAIDAANLFNQKHGGWVYQIPSYKAGDLTKALADLTEAAAEEPQTTTADEAQMQEAAEATDVPAAVTEGQAAPVEEPAVTAEAS
jgi:hypothetical protein